MVILILVLCYMLVRRDPLKGSSHAQSILDEVSTWSANIKFQLHPSKCNELRIIFARSPTKYELVEITGCKIHTVHVVKLLGVYIQEDLKWNTLVREMTKKAAKRLYFLVQLKRAKVPPEELVQFCVACIQSVLLYGCQVFPFSLPKYPTLSFERIQKRALRIIFGYEVYCADALARSGLVTLEQRRTEICKKLFNKIEDNPLDVVYPLIPFDERPTQDLRNIRPYRVRPSKTNRCRETFINTFAVLF